MEDSIQPEAPASPATFASPNYSLFDPSAVGAATFLGSPLGGSIVMALNYRRLGKGGSAAAVLAVGAVLTGLTLLLAFSVSSNAVNALPIASFVAMLYAAKGLQGSAVEQHQRLGGPLASRWTAAGIGLAVLVPILLVITAVVMLDTPSAKVIIGTKDEVQYSGFATEADARALGDALKSIGYFQDRGVTAVLTKNRNGCTISFVVKDGFSGDSAHVALFEQIARQVAPAVGGLPLKLRLVNSMLESQKELNLQ